MSESKEYDWIEEARECAAQCWCSTETSSKEMDVELAEVFAGKIAFWMREAARNMRNTEYYRGLLVQCGELIGEDAYIADDGTRSDSVLCAKIPDIVKTLKEQDND